MPRDRGKLADDERVSRFLWFMAGGMGPPPMGAALKGWKAKDRAVKKREGGGFWREVGRVLGGRRGRKRKRKEGGVGEGEEGKEAEGKEAEEETAAAPEVVETAAAAET
ncbi:MAG: hypothetical protein L6R40_008382 [Gallowayella cf. fulva]|nr:MAG: hypothetical protein L6R40_008382 [Xanthomendoza cf. fulva]